VQNSGNLFTFFTNLYYETFWILILVLNIPWRFFLFHRFRLICLKDESCSYTSHFLYHAPCAVVVLAQVLYAYYFWLAYGTVALFLGPLRTWSAIMGFYLWFTVVNLKDHDFAEARLVWHRRSRSRSHSSQSENGYLNNSHNHTHS